VLSLEKGKEEKGPTTSPLDHELFIGRKEGGKKEDSFLWVQEEGRGGGKSVTSRAWVHLFFREKKKGHILLRKKKKRRTRTVC